MEVETETQVMAETDIKMTSPEKETPEEVSTDTKSPTKEDSSKSIPTVGDHKKNNGTLAGVAAAAAATAVVRKEEKPMAGIVVQLPEMFSIKRDGHILNKFEDAADVRLQKIAFVECESEEAAAALHAKLNNTDLNAKRLSSSRLDTTEKNVLYVGALKKETTDEMLKELLPGIEEVRREKYNTFILFIDETHCRGARTKVCKEGIYGQTLHCDFDARKDRFKPAEEPPAKKQKEDSESQPEDDRDVPNPWTESMQILGMEDGSATNDSAEAKKDGEEAPKGDEEMEEAAAAEEDAPEEEDAPKDDVKADE